MKKEVTVKKLKDLRQVVSNHETGAVLDSAIELLSKKSKPKPRPKIRYYRKKGFNEKEYTEFVAMIPNNGKDTNGYHANGCSIVYCIRHSFSDAVELKISGRSTLAHYKTYQECTRIEFLTGLEGITGFFDMRIQQLLGITA